ncbi:traf3ip2 [Pungitius sinensis]
MEESEKGPELKWFFTMNNSNQVTVNQIFDANLPFDRSLPTCYMNADYFCQEIPCRGGQVNQECRSQPAADALHVELMQHRQPGDREDTSAVVNLDHHPRLAETSERNTRGKSSCWDGGPDRADLSSSHLQSDEEDLEPPLPLRSVDEVPKYRPLLPPHHYLKNCNPRCVMDARYYHSAGEVQYNPGPLNTYPPQAHHHCASCPPRRHRDDTHTWLGRRGNFMIDSMAPGNVSVNVPQYSAPPLEGVSQVNVMNPEASFSHPYERRRPISLPDECRNVFVTYSLDLSSEIVPFGNFLTKQGFRPAIYIFDDNIGRVDINWWMDGYLKHPSAMIIIAISPKYKADIEGSAVDSHGLHTKYIHSMMQHEFIHQGSLNFRFIPLLFPNTSQEHVPCWLQNTRVYRWPQDSEDLLLRLLNEERFIPPPVPLELTLSIRPLTPSATATL